VILKTKLHNSVIMYVKCTPPLSTEVHIDTEVHYDTELVQSASDRLLLVAARHSSPGALARIHLCGSVIALLRFMDLYEFVTPSLRQLLGRYLPCCEPCRNSQGMEPTCQRAWCWVESAPTAQTSPASPDPQTLPCR